MVRSSPSSSSTSNRVDGNLSAASSYSSNLSSYDSGHNPRHPGKEHGTNATTIGLAEAKNNFSRVTAEVNRTGKPVTMLRNNRPWVTISPAAGIAKPDMVAVAVDFMDEYANVFDELSK